ncbi:BTB/POZ domain-containing protein 17 [Aplysia californica]|uniref:BTB/POZ domain-containing protein 17 n=1 Tax=Aplysia californica TaxID=6500 RepID=A0ABM0JY08_APLCA|nr:BTB/POZ domain-containing protein 17 [Aplysia californica]
MAGAGEIIISNASGLSFRLQSLYQSGDMCDIQINVGKKTFQAHKLILCASSDVFKTMLTSVRWTEANKQSIVLVEDRSCETIFDRFLHYIYSGELFVSHATVGPLFILADKYNIRDLIPLCRRYMLENLDAPVDDLSVLQWWQIANLHRDFELQEKTLSYIELNFSKVIQTTDFLNANVHTLNILLSSSRIVIPNELMLFYGLKHWLEAYIECSCSSLTVRELKKVFKELTRHIRWPMMTKDELEWLQEDSDMQQFIATYRNFMYLPSPEDLELDSTDEPGISDPWCFVAEFTDRHCLNVEPRCSASPKSDLKKRKPRKIDNGICDKNRSAASRVYLSDHWSSSLTVSDFAAFPRYGTRTFFFSTPRTGFRRDTSTLDWEVEVHPKGVHFQPAILIGLERDGNKVVDETFVNTVRVSVMSRSPAELPVKVEVNILVQASSPSNPDCLYIERCRRQVCIFDSSSSRHNLDDIVPQENMGVYLQPDVHFPGLAVSPTLAFSLGIVIRPID